MWTDGLPSRNKRSPNSPRMPADLAWRESVHVRKRVTKNIVASNTTVSIISMAWIDHQIHYRKEVNSSVDGRTSVYDVGCQHRGGNRDMKCLRWFKGRG